MITIEPHLTPKPVAYKNEGEEFLFVMSGELEFTLGAKTRVLMPGESVHSNSDVPHKLQKPVQRSGQVSGGGLHDLYFFRRTTTCFF